MSAPVSSNSEEGKVQVFVPPPQCGLDAPPAELTVTRKRASEAVLDEVPEKKARFAPRAYPLSMRDLKSVDAMIGTHNHINSMNEFEGDSIVVKAGFTPAGLDEYKCRHDAFFVLSRGSDDGVVQTKASAYAPYEEDSHTYPVAFWNRKAFVITVPKPYQESNVEFCVTPFKMPVTVANQQLDFGQNGEFNPTFVKPFNVFKRVRSRKTGNRMFASTVRNPHFHMFVNSDSAIVSDMFEFSCSSHLSLAHAKDCKYPSAVLPEMGEVESVKRVLPHVIIFNRIRTVVAWNTVTNRYAILQTDGIFTNMICIANRFLVPLFDGKLDISYFYKFHDLNELLSPQQTTLSLEVKTQSYKMPRGFQLQLPENHSLVSSLWLGSSLWSIVSTPSGDAIYPVPKSFIANAEKLIVDVVQNLAK